MTSPDPFIIVYPDQCCPDCYCVEHDDGTSLAHGFTDHEDAVRLVRRMKTLLAAARADECRTTAEAIESELACSGYYDAARIARAHTEEES